jgi:hypothetical protein
VGGVPGLAGGGLSLRQSRGLWSMGLERLKGAGPAEWRSWVPVGRQLGRGLRGGSLGERILLVNRDMEKPSPARGSEC